MIPCSLCVFYVHHRIKQMIWKHITCSSHKDVTGFLEFSYIFFRDIFLRKAIFDLENFGLQFSLNSTPNHSNTHWLRWIHHAAAILRSSWAERVGRRCSAGAKSHWVDVAHGTCETTAKILLRHWPTRVSSWGSRPGPFSMTALLREPLHARCWRRRLFSWVDTNHGTRVTQQAQTACVHQYSR
jgi:hypothetical protein